MLLVLHLKELLKPFYQINSTWKLPLATAIKQKRQGTTLDEQILWHISLLLKSLAGFFNFSLRAQEQIILKMRMFLSALTVDTDILLPELLSWNVCLYVFDKNLYHKFQNDKLSQTILSTKVPSDLFSNNKPNLSFLDELLRPQEYPHCSLSYSLPVWIDALLDPKKRLENGQPAPFEPSVINAAQKYLMLTPFL